MKSITPHMFSEKYRGSTIKMSPVSAWIGNTIMFITVKIFREKDIAPFECWRIC